MQRRVSKSLLKKSVVSPKNHFFISAQPISRSFFSKYSEPTSFSQNFDNSLDPAVIRYHHSQIVEKFNRFFSKEAKESKESKEPEPKATEEKKQENQEKQEAKTEEKKKDEENSDKQDDKEKSNRDMFSILTNLFFAGGILYVALSLGGKQVAPAEAQEITFQTLVQKYIGSEELHHLVYDLKSNKVYVYLTKDISSDNPVANPRYSYFVNVLSQTDFEHKIQDAEERLRIPATQRTKIIYRGGFNTSEVIATVIEALIFFGLPVLLFRRFGRGGKGSDGGSMLDIFGVGKVGSKTSHNVKTTFADVAGMKEAKLEIQEFVSILKSPEKYRKLGAKTPRGAILMGPPGTGKTLLAKAVAGESKVPFFSISGSDFVEMFVGVGPARVRDLFKRAREAKDAIIYIDEIDAIGRPRGMNSMYGGGNDERENTLNQLLVEMDGMNENHNIVILASTNVEKDGLDKALLRPGRFDRQIVVDKPDQQEREEVFQVHLKPLKLSEEVKHGIHRLAQLTPGFSGADIANVCNEAAIYAAREGREEVTMANMEKAVERVVGGLEKKNMPILPEDKKVIAFHEAGHAIVSWFLRYCDPLLKISIIPRGKALGYAQYLPAERYIRTYDHLMDIISQALGGRVAEKLIFDHLSTGAKDDLQKITRIAYMAVSSFGMSPEVGLLSFPPPGDPSISVQKPYSEETARKIDEEARKIISVGYARAEQILTEKKDILYKVAEYLLVHETMSMEQFKAIVGPRPHEAVAAAPEQNAVAGTTTEATSQTQQQQ